jgi:hypothetical protein
MAFKAYFLRVLENIRPAISLQDEFRKLGIYYPRLEPDQLHIPDDPVKSVRLAIFISTPTLAAEPIPLMETGRENLEYLGMQSREVLALALTLGSLNPTVRLI